MNEEEPKSGLTRREEQTVFSPSKPFAENRTVLEAAIAEAKKASAGPGEPPSETKSPLTSGLDAAQGDAAAQQGHPQAPELTTFHNDQTVFRPNPAGRRPLLNATQSKMTELGIFPKGGFPRQAAVQGTELTAPNENPLLQAAGPLLLLLGRLRCALLRAQVSDLIPQIGEAIQKFAADGERARFSIDTITNAKYMLCLTADEVLSHLPTDDGVAPRGKLLARFFGQTDGGNRLFEILDSAKADPQGNAALIELCHACLALGFQGSQQNLAGAALVLDSRLDLFDILQKQKPALPQPLSAHWHGQSIPSQALGWKIPVWVAGVLLGLGLFSIFLLLRVSLIHRADAAAELMASLNPRTLVTLDRPAPVPPPPPPPPTPTQISQFDHIRQALAPQIQDGSLSVEANANQIGIHINDKILFSPAKADLLDDVKALITDIGKALDETPGAIEVIGHTDNKPIANARFASNFELSLERARAVAAILKQSLSHPERVEAIGRGADVPLVSNDTPEGRTKNRRVEIIVARSD